LQRDLKISGISPQRFKELDAFCKQYPEKCQKLKEIRNPLGAQNLSGMPSGSSVDSQTESAAIRAYPLSKDTELIEQTALKVSSRLYQQIICYVTTGRRQFDTRAENRLFVALVKDFYAELHKKR
jgi:hypothetical protein